MISEDTGRAAIEPAATSRSSLSRVVRTLVRRVGAGLVWCSVVVLVAWSAGAIFYFRFWPRAIGACLGITYVGMGFILWRWVGCKRRWLGVAVASVVVVYLGTLIQRPSHDRQWDADHARMAEIAINGDDVLITDFRHCTYRTELDYDAQYGELNFRLDQLQSVWFGVQRFTPLEGVAHTFLSFEIQTAAGPRYFCVSVEIRRERGEAFSPIKGMYREYELIYVVADERDVVGVRTVHRPNDQVYLYPVNANASQVQQLFRDISVRIEGIHGRPEFYNSFTNNCTNNIAAYTSQLTPEPINVLDPRIVLPGYSDRLAHAWGLIGEPGQSFETVRDSGRIDDIARRTPLTERFSDVIRAKGPGQPAVE